MAKQIPDGIRKAVETLCLTGGIYTCILLALQYIQETDVTEKRDIVFVMVGFATISMIYCLVRIVVEIRKSRESSNK